MTSTLAPRWLAFGIHLTVSILILALLLLVIFFVWYPYDLIYAGGIDGLKIIIGVDLVLGPLLTLIIYTPNKKGLNFDLSMIALLQFVCLIGGLWLVYNERPLVQVLADDGIHLIAASDFEYYDIELVDFPGSTPKHILLDLPEDRSTISSIKMATELADNKPFMLRTDLYRPMVAQSKFTYERRIAFIRESLSATQFNVPKHLGKLNCDWIPIHSKHFVGYACTSYEKGVIKLSRKTNEASADTN